MASQITGRVVRASPASTSAASFSRDSRQPVSLSAADSPAGSPSWAAMTSVPSTASHTALGDGNLSGRRYSPRARRGGGALGEQLVRRLDSIAGAPEQPCRGADGDHQRSAELAGEPARRAGVYRHAVEESLDEQVMRRVQDRRSLRPQLSGEPFGDLGCQRFLDCEKIGTVSQFGQEHELRVGIRRGAAELARPAGRRSVLLAGS